MNQANVNCLRKFQRDYFLPSVPQVLDVGSMSVHGQTSGRSLWPFSESYVGADIAAGENVDVVIPAEGTWDLKQQFDLVTALSTFEHCKRPWELIRTLAQHIKPGGYVFVVAPFCFHEHRYPVDCFRYLPDGMRSLAESAGLQVCESYIYTTWPWTERTPSNLFWNCWQIGWKQIVSRECVLVARKRR